MIYAAIVLKENSQGKGYDLEFYGENIIQERDLWNIRILPYYDNKTSKDINFDGLYLNSKSKILDHLAERGFVPGGDNIFYRKGFFDFLR
ncbi:hypothetical protein H7169_02490 [Candidatus Gracilibacteria bacterium]|nr:hypothetical protein [Candidatus Gracilibacteria bacterium]